MLVALRTKVEELAGLKAGVTEEQLEQRFAQADEGVAQVSRRVDDLGSSVDEAVTSLTDKEHELAALNRHFTESSTRIESIVEDIRDALSAFPELGSANVDDLAARLERVVERVEAFEAATREQADARERASAELAHRIDVLEQQLGTVASEVARARTLWPVALRSLEARLDDVASHARRPEAVAAAAAAAAPEPGGDAEPETATDDDLVASLRDSLQAMETVAAEMTRASDALGSKEDTVETHEAVAAGGGTVVPLRSDP